MEMTCTCWIIHKTENYLLRLFTCVQTAVVIESKWIHFFLSVNFRFIWLLSVGCERLLHSVGIINSRKLNVGDQHEMKNSRRAYDEMKVKNKNEKETEVTFFILIKIIQIWDPLFSFVKSPFIPFSILLSPFFFLRSDLYLISALLVIPGGTMNNREKKNFC